MGKSSKCICCRQVLQLRPATLEGKTKASSASRDDPGEMRQRERGCSAAEDARCPSWESCVGSRRNIPGARLGVQELEGQCSSARAGQWPGFFSKSHEKNGKSFREAGFSVCTSLGPPWWVEGVSCLLGTFLEPCPKCFPGPTHAPGKGPSMPRASTTAHLCPGAESALGKPGVLLVSLGTWAGVG